MRIRYLLVLLLICALLAACGAAQTGLHSLTHQISKHGTGNSPTLHKDQVSQPLAALKADSLPIAIILLVIVGVGVLAIKEKPDDVRAPDRQTGEELDHIIRHYTQVIHQDPGYAIAFFNRGLAYYSRDELELAIRDFDAAIQLIPADYEAYYYRGLAYVDKGEKEKAITDFKKALELCGNSSEILCMHAHSALEKLGVKLRSA